MVIDARSAGEIEREYPELTIFAKPPDFFSSDEQGLIASSQHYDIDAEPEGHLAAIVRDRRPRRAGPCNGPA